MSAIDYIFLVFLGAMLLNFPWPLFRWTLPIRLGKYKGFKPDMSLDELMAAAKPIGELSFWQYGAIWTCTLKAKLPHSTAEYKSEMHCTSAKAALMECLAKYEEDRKIL